MQEIPPEPAAGLTSVPDGLTTEQTLVLLPSPERRRLLNVLDRLETPTLPTPSRS